MRNHDNNKNNNINHIISGKDKCKGKEGPSKNNNISASFKVGLQLCVGHIGCYLRQGKYTIYMVAGAPVYLADVLEYFCTEILKFSNNSA